MLFKSAFLFFIFTSLLLGNSSFGAISSGAKNGTYYKVANDISTIFKKYKAKVNVIPSKGSLENLDKLTHKDNPDDIKWAIIQSDTLSYYKYLNQKKGKKDITKTIKTVLPLYTEYIHIFAKKGKKIAFKKGTKLKVGISSQTSESYITAQILASSYALKFEYIFENFKTSLKYLQDDKLDIVINVIPYPNLNFKKLENLTLVNLPQKKSLNKRYIRTKFSKERYPWLKNDIHTYKVPNVLVTNQTDKKANQNVSLFLKIILTNYKALTKYGHPLWREAYRNKTMKIDNMHPVAYSILHK